MSSLLPINATKAERALEAACDARLGALAVPLRDLWSPQNCPEQLLPWLGWGLSIDVWNPAWSEAQKRAAVTDAIAFQRTKGTPASVRYVLDRIDTAIGLVEWWQDREVMEPHTFRLELPLSGDSAVEWDADLVAALLRDIEAVKPVRAHFTAIYRVLAAAKSSLISFALPLGFGRYDVDADEDAAADDYWDLLLLTEDGEPIANEAGALLEDVD